jgi:hypothetical protein
LLVQRPDPLDLAFTAAGELGRFRNTVPAGTQRLDACVHGVVCAAAGVFARLAGQLEALALATAAEKGGWLLKTHTRHPPQ